MFTAWLNLTKDKPSPPTNPECLSRLCAKILSLKRLIWENLCLDAGCFVVFDTETTGLLAHKGDEIISVGAVQITNNELTTRNFCKLVNPFRDIPEPVSRLTGITSDMAQTGEDILSVLDQFLEFVGPTPLVAHNSQFDLSFINQKLRRNFKQTLGIPVLDTYLIAQLLHPYRKSYSLDSLARLYEIPLDGRHTSLGDSIITGRIFTLMVEELLSRGIKNMDQLTSSLKFRRLM